MTVPASEPPETGDPVVDAALRDLAATEGDLQAQVEAVTQAYRRLQQRLSEPAGPAAVTAVSRPRPDERAARA